MPLAAGLVGIIPALGLLTPEERPGGPVTFTPAQLLAWCSALAFFGVFVAVPLRYQTIIREQLRFPSGTATASVIRTLHGLPPQHEDSAGQAVSGSAGSGWGVEGAATAAGVSNGWAKQRPSDGDQGGLLGRGTEQQQGAGSGSGAGLSQVDLEVAVLTVSDCCHYYKHVPMLAGSAPWVHSVALCVGPYVQVYFSVPVLLCPPLHPNSSVVSWCYRGSNLCEPVIACSSVSRSMPLYSTATTDSMQQEAAACCGSINSSSSGTGRCGCCCGALQCLALTA